MIFETSSDRSNQDRLQWILEHMGYRVTPTSTLCGYDFILHRGKREHAIVEYKARDKLWDPLIIDQHKITTLVSAAVHRGVKPIFIIGCPGPPYHFIAAHTSYPVSTFTRKRNADRRGESQDTVFEIPQKEFQLMG